MKKLSIIPIIAALALAGCTSSQVTTSVTAGLAAAESVLAILSAPMASGQSQIPVAVAIQVDAYMTCAMDGFSAVGKTVSGLPAAQQAAAIGVALTKCLLSPAILAQLPANALVDVQAVEAAVNAVLAAYGVAPVTANALGANSATSAKPVPDLGFFGRRKIAKAGNKAAELSSAFAKLYVQAASRKYPR